MDKYLDRIENYKFIKVENPSSIRQNKIITISSNFKNTKIQKKM